jgi:hypothetical protein
MNMGERREGDKGIKEWKVRRNCFRVKRGQERRRVMTTGKTNKRDGKVIRGRAGRR